MTADLAVADLMVVGAGPAGMAASVLASEFGLDTVLFDEQASPGGQIYRAIERAGEGRAVHKTRRSAPIILRAARSPLRCAPAECATGRE